MISSEVYQYLNRYALKAFAKCVWQHSNGCIRELNTDYLCLQLDKIQAAGAKGQIVICKRDSDPNQPKICFFSYLRGRN